ncbi:fasciclin domain-containing protein [Niabella defluvii]|nr:fasciclin domain-containing protein [Niabella sp. I65]
MTDYVKQRNLLKTAGSYTVFIPSNTAFEQLFKTLSETGKAITSIKDRSPEFWINYFRYHLLNEKLMPTNSSSALYPPQPYSTINT